MHLLPRQGILPGGVLLCFVVFISLSHALEQSPRFKIQPTHLVNCTRKTHSGDKIKVHYRGTLESDGSEFDSSYPTGSPITFVLGVHQVIDGWDQGLTGMCAGEERKLTIPPELGYGDRAMGGIPAGSTLIFETKLVEIVETTPAKDTKDKHDKAGSPDGPQDKTSGECSLLGPFALVVQAALGVLALLSLVFKRWRERPRRPVKVWFFDVSKQVVGTALLHVFNIAMSMFSSNGVVDAAMNAQDVVTAAEDEHGNMPNPCSFYLLNLAIDTTIGIPVLVVFLKLFHAIFLRTSLANPPESIKSGHYGSPPKVTWWTKQCLIYFLGLICMKIFVFFLFAALPWLSWVGDWALRWTEGNESLQIAFVMFIFPLAMNMIQYYIIDAFIKDKGGEVEQGRSGYQEVDTDEHYDSFEESGVTRSADYDEDIEGERVKTATEDSASRTGIERVDACSSSEETSPTTPDVKDSLK